MATRASLVITASAALLALTGCRVGPNYQRPTVAMPPQYRSAPSAPDPASLGDQKWVEIFQDKVLQTLVQEALTNNRDLKVSAQRILAAGGQLNSTRSALFP